MLSRSVDIRDYMKEAPVTIGPDADLTEAVKKILAHKISGLCVVDENHKLLGMLSEMDCLQGILSATYNQSGAMGLVSEYMTPEVEVASLQDDIINIANEMMNKHHRRRPVVDGGKLIGQITCRQLLSAVKDFQK